MAQEKSAVDGKMKGTYCNTPCRIVETHGKNPANQIPAKKENLSIDNSCNVYPVANLHMSSQISPKIQGSTDIKMPSRGFKWKGSAIPKTN
jgi:hypothetical protein